MSFDRKNDQREFLLTDDVDTAELLHEHDNTGSEGSTTVARDGEEFEDRGTTSRNVGLFLEERIDHEEIAGGLELGVSETTQRLVGVAVATATAVEREV